MRLKALLTPRVPKAGETSEAISATVRAEAGGPAKGMAVGNGSTTAAKATTPAEEEECDEEPAEPAEKGIGRRLEETAGALLLAEGSCRLHKPAGLRRSETPAPAKPGSTSPEAVARYGSRRARLPGRGAGAAAARVARPPMAS